MNMKKKKTIKEEDEHIDEYHEHVHQNSGLI
jgi:hypothetical protein